MTIDDYFALRDDLRQPTLAGYYRIEAAPTLRVAGIRLTPPARRGSSPPVRPAGHRAEPSRVCLVCHEPAFLVGRTLMCEWCRSEILWRVSLARRGLRIVG